MTVLKAVTFDTWTDAMYALMRSAIIFELARGTRPPRCGDMPSGVGELDALRDTLGSSPFRLSPDATPFPDSAAVRGEPWSA